MGTREGDNEAKVQLDAEQLKEGIKTAVQQAEALQGCGRGDGDIGVSEVTIDLGTERLADLQARIKGECRLQRSMEQARDVHALFEGGNKLVCEQLRKEEDKMLLLSAKRIESKSLDLKGHENSQQAEREEMEILVRAILAREKQVVSNESKVEDLKDRDFHN